MAENANSIPSWVRSVLQKRGQADGSGAVSDTDVSILSAALEGIEQNVLKVRFGLDMQGILASFRRVREAVRRGEVPARLVTEYPWLIRWIKREPSKLARKAKYGVLVPPVSHETAEAIAGITDRPYGAIDLDNPKSMPDFLSESKARFAAIAGPLALRRMAEATAAGEPWAIEASRDFLYGQHRGGPLVALQQNFAKDNPRETGSGAFVFDNIILALDKEHPEEVGESTVFDDQLLEMQKSEEET